MPRQPVYVDAVKAPERIQAGLPLELVVDGNLPTPAWEVQEVTMEREGHAITVTVWAIQRDSGPVIQVLVPFSRRIPITDLTPGAWTIDVRGHGDTSHHLKIEVTPAVKS